MVDHKVHDFDPKLIHGEVFINFNKIKHLLSGFARVTLFEGQIRNYGLVNKKFISLYEGFIDNGNMSGFGRLIDTINVKEAIWNNQWFSDSV